ncbi:NitT/TauT family transport system substrate-binding protein [Actinokineospora alba]|uniref:NitT/TauT family transport system substrate-binding protein n=1 Tax=Actinokineospora alba TaxID=504798 RepID=A0A1H0K7K6_9PSEU|nr:ABC transporter substrate-binding protein [Actinokineospora alba]TDP68018.1 NitT/TauT family transport system substrate-binding protein [Actinokineospora alba]SDH90794.1 NitT/TauT family transport system substrate-binding protein [Actinokineospora alba]SDO51763.1 NitT/TauT family transport system substrate-binding protein [Actinokineospora alba]
MKTRLSRLALAGTVALSLLAAACSRTEGPKDAAADGPSTDKGPAAELRLGFFPNVTHASALIGLEKGLFAKELGNTKLVPTKFNDGPTEVSAFLGGSLDAGFIGSGPAINAFAKSNGEAVRLIAGGTSGGAQLVVSGDITKPEDLAGKTVVTPALGNTQDVSLKKWLVEKGLEDKVQVTNRENPQTFDAFKKGEVQAAWLPEPWSSRLVLDAGAKVLIDEKDLWKDGKFPTTVLLVRTQFLKDHPQTVQALLRGLLAANDFAKTDVAGAKTAVNTQLQSLTGKGLAAPVIDRAFTSIELNPDPLAGTFPQLSKDAVTAGVAPKETDLAGFVDLTALNAVLKAAGKPAADAAGLDKK